MTTISTRTAWIATLCLSIAACASTGPRRGSGFDLYIVRHAETVANVTKEYTNETQRRFSDKGQQEIRALAKQLGAEKIDRVIVSPTVRALKTIAPYLEQEDRSAEIWPELEECCWQGANGNARLHELPRGARVEVEPTMEPLFVFRSESFSHWYDARTVEESNFVVKRALTELMDRFSHSGEKVVVISHFNVGQKLIAALTEQGEAATIILETGKVTHLRQEKDGRFRILTLNDQPIASATP